MVSRHPISIPLTQISLLHPASPRYAALEGESSKAAATGAGAQPKKLKPRKQQPGGQDGTGAGAGGGDDESLAAGKRLLGEVEVDVGWLCVLWQRALLHPNTQVGGLLYCRLTVVLYICTSLSRLLATCRVDIAVSQTNSS